MLLKTLCLSSSFPFILRTEVSGHGDASYTSNPALGCVQLGVRMAVPHPVKPTKPGLLKHKAEKTAL